MFFLSMLSAFVRRNTELGHRPAPIYTNGEITTNANASISVDIFLAS